MIWTLEWGPVVRRDLLSIPWPVAARLCAAVMRFAETSQGPVKRISPHDRQRLKLVVSGAIAYLLADERTGVLHVTRAFARI